MAWSYGGWRREATRTLQRSVLITHIEEVEAELAKFEQQGMGPNSGRRRDLTAYLARLDKFLTSLEASLGLDVDSEVDTFVQAKPTPHPELGH